MIFHPEGLFLIVWIYKIIVIKILDLPENTFMCVTYILGGRQVTWVNTRQLKVVGFVFLFPILKL